MPNGGPGRFLQCSAHRYHTLGNIDVPLVDSVFASTNGLQVRRLVARNACVNRVWCKYIVYYVAARVERNVEGVRMWEGELMVFRVSVRGERLVNMRGRDDLLSRHIARR